MLVLLMNLRKSKIFEFCRACQLRFVKPRRVPYCNKCYRLQISFKVKPEYIQEFIRGQGNKCAICGGHPRKRALVVDYDHETGIVRGLLCTRCNMGLGYFKTLELIDAAQTYLTKAQAMEVPEKFIKEPRGEITRILLEVNSSIDESLPMRQRGRLIAQKLGISEEAAVSRLRRLNKNEANS